MANLLNIPVVVPFSSHKKVEKVLQNKLRSIRKLKDVKFWPEVLDLLQEEGVIYSWTISCYLRPQFTAHARCANVEEIADLLKRFKNFGLWAFGNPFIDEHNSYTAQNFTTEDKTIDLELCCYLDPGLGSDITCKFVETGEEEVVRTRKRVLKCFDSQGNVIARHPDLKSELTEILRPRPAATGFLEINNV